MGNRACVVFTNGREFSPAIYLHWNGGPESVYAFLDALQRYGAMSDHQHAAARFTQLVGNFLGGSLSIALLPLRAKRWQQCDPGDHGIYLVNLGPAHCEVRRIIDGKELPAQEVCEERAAVRRHRYRATAPTIDERIDAVNRGHFMPPHALSESPI